MGRYRGFGTDFFTEGRRNQAQENRIAALEDKVSGLSSIRVTLPEPHEPFTVVHRPGKKGDVAVLPIDLPSSVETLVITLIKTNDRDTNAHYANRRLENRFTVTDDQRTAGYGEFEFGFLDYNTQYDVLRLKAIDDGGNRLVNPPDDPARTDSPLETFTTPAAYGSPSAPHVGNIIENKMDDTTKAFDAFVTVQIIAPYLSSANITGTVAITSGSTTVTGTGTSFTSLATGQGITVNGETHIISAIADNTHLTTDYAFKQTLSGQTASAGSLQTWGSIKSDPAQETGLPATRVVAKFRLTDDTNAHPINPSYYFSESEASGTSIKYRIPGFIAARKYDWISNSIIESVGDEIARQTIAPLTTQTFIAGNFTADTAGIPELTTPTWKYDLIDPDNSNQRNTRFYITQPNPPVALDNVEIQRRITGTGTIAYTNGNTTITGTGTAFTTEVSAGNTINVGTYLAAGYQRLVVSSVTNDTSLTVETAPNATASGQAFKIGRIETDRDVRRMKFHPTGGGQIKFNLGSIKTKKLVSQDFVVILTSQLGNQREDVDNFTTTNAGDVPSDTAVPGTLGTPAITFTRKAGVTIAGMSVGSQWNQPVGKKVVIYTDTGGTTYFDLPTYISSGGATGQAAASESAAQFAIGVGKEHVTLDVALWALKTALGTSADVKCYFYATNIIGTTQSANSTTYFNVANAKDHISSGGSVNNVAVGVTMDGKLNLIPNSDCLGDSGVAGTLNKFFVWNGSGSPSNVANQTSITTVAAAGAKWNQAQHCIEIANAGAVVRVCINLKKRFTAGDKYYWSLQGRTTSGTLASGSVVVKVLKDANPTVENEDTAINQSLSTVATSYVVIAGNLRVKDSPDFDNGAGGYADQYLDMEVTVPNGSTLQIDRFYLKRGEQPGAWEPTPADSDSPPVSVVPSTSIGNPDLGTPSGSQGGYVTGSGSSRIIPTTLE